MVIDGLVHLEQEVGVEQELQMSQLVLVVTPDILEVEVVMVVMVEVQVEMVEKILMLGERMGEMEQVDWD